MTREEYIEHEVKLRLHNALFSHIDYKFTAIENRIDKLEGKFNWVIGLILSGILMPIILKHFGY